MFVHCKRRGREERSGFRAKTRQNAREMVYYTDCCPQFLEVKQEGGVICDTKTRFELLVLQEELNRGS